MQIVSASRRTDIPAFYSQWLMNRLRAGFAKVPNPFNPRQVSTVMLRPEMVACLMLVTKDPRPMIACLDELDHRGYRYCFQVTMTGLPRMFEPKVPGPGAITPAMLHLARRLGADRVIWRFDPILLSPSVTQARIVSTFATLAEKLAGSVTTVIVSFARNYRSAGRRLARAAADEPVHFLAGDATEKRALAEALAAVAVEKGMRIQSCAEPVDLTSYGIKPGSCIDVDLIRRLFDIELAPAKDRGQRTDCRCARSVDLGIYGTCSHGCLYCYASCDSRLTGGEMHDPTADSLLGMIGEPEESQPFLL
ncbi:DUF1848 domain-containing protein [Geobacter sp. DSM 9736]|uniref:DUF1848 domain-containing protein n=1 Tax=Geobacter sp. DSM 9736 TaxID=1277350 RepID=UPI000B50803C|nr:DUF1848 domain-containing protein [Geobacter sp. DSM 9736]SNB48093.1 protein of unknown function [Geobacter sp. DSM 9736]